MSHVDIAHSVTPRPIMEIGERLGLAADELLPYGRYKAKVALSALDRLKGRPLGRYVLVTAINPTPLGEGKTTISSVSRQVKIYFVHGNAIGVAMGLCRLGHRAVVTLRQPSLGPVFGIKGGGAGGGRAQVTQWRPVTIYCPRSLIIIDSTGTRSSLTPSGWFGLVPWGLAIERYDRSESARQMENIFGSVSS